MQLYSIKCSASPTSSISKHPKYCFRAIIKHHHVSSCILNIASWLSSIKHSASPPLSHQAPIMFFKFTTEISVTFKFCTLLDVFFLLWLHSYDKNPNFITHIPDCILLVNLSFRQSIGNCWIVLLFILFCNPWCFKKTIFSILVTKVYFEVHSMLVCLHGLL